MFSGIGFIGGIITNLLTNGSKAAMDVWRGKAEEKREEAKWQRERAQMQFEADMAHRQQAIIAERQENIAIEKTQQARIKESANVGMASQWVIDLTKSVRPVLSYLIISQYIFVTSWGMVNGLISWVQIAAGIGLLAEAVVGFYFSDRVFRKKHK